MQCVMEYCEARRTTTDNRYTRVGRNWNVWSFVCYIVTVRAQCWYGICDVFFVRDKWCQSFDNFADFIKINCFQTWSFAYKSYVNTNQPFVAWMSWMETCMCTIALQTSRKLYCTIHAHGTNSLYFYWVETGIRQRLEIMYWCNSNAINQLGYYHSK